MAFNIVESVIELPHKFNHLYYDQGSNLRKLGDPQMGFSDADIVGIHNFGWHGEHHELKFYKERIYAAPDRILFTIFDVQTNLVLTELHVILHEKRSFYRANRETRGRVLPNFTLLLKIIQDPNKRVYRWTGEYF